MMLKDAVFSIAFLSLTLYLLEIEFSQGDKLKEPGFLIRFMFITFLFMLSKNQCIYIVWLLIPAVLLFRQKGKWRMTGSLLVPALAYMLFLHLLLPALHVAPVGRQEFHGFMFQQTALYLKEHPADVRAEERKAIAALLPYERIAQLYDPDCQDPVKFSYNVAASDEDFSRYRTAHLHMMLRHPDIALKSLWQGCNAFFYPSARFPIFFPLLATDAPPRPDFYDLHPLFHPQPSGMKTALSLPVPLRWLFDVGFYIPLAFIGCVILLFKGKILPFLPVLISIGILVLSPENGCFRYAMPIIWLLPFLPLFIVLPPDNKIPRHAPLRHHTGL